MGQVDLHVHSTRSDGTLTPTELVKYALEKRLSAIALTDHDTVDGIDEAIEAAKGTGLTVIPGIEYSTNYHNRDVHIVGLFIDHKAPVFQRYLEKFKQSRIDRNHKLCANLQSVGFDITYDALLEMFPDAIITRAHYAKFLLEKGYVKSRQEAFDRYLGDHTPYFVHREKITPEEVIEVTRKAGGIPILAHPTLYKFGKEQLELLISTLKNHGLMGIECVYSTYTPSEEREIKAYAQKYHLLPSGGSDFHGANKPGLDLGIGYGKLHVPDEYMLAIKEKAGYHYRILYSDLDGTLLNSDKKISDQTRKAICNLLEHGHKFVLASGRPLYSILERKNALGLPDHGMYITAYNGALLYDCENARILAEYKLPVSTAQQIFELASEKQIHIHTFSDQKIISIADDEELAYYTSFIPSEVVISNNLGHYFTDGPFKLLAIDLNEKITGALNDFRAEINQNNLITDVTTSFSHPTYLEFYSSMAGKGNGLKHLCELLDIPLEASIAVGDEENDISMLETAGLGIAMQNASTLVKNHADYITKMDCNHDAIIEIIEKFFP